MAKKKPKLNKIGSEDKEWISVPTEAFKPEEEIKEELQVKGKKRGNYEEKLSVNLSFEELIKLSVGQSSTMKSLAGVDKKDKPKPK